MYGSVQLANPLDNVLLLPALSPKANNRSDWILLWRSGKLRLVYTLGGLLAYVPGLCSAEAQGEIVGTILLYWKL